MIPADLNSRLDRVKAGPVKVVLSAKKVVPHIPRSGLWPRVTLTLDGRQEIVALTYYADVKRPERSPSKLDKLEVAILRLCGVDSRSMRSVQRAGRPLREAVQRIRERISSAMAQAQTTRKLGARIEQVRRKGRRSEAERTMKQSFRNLLRGTVKVNDLTPGQVAAWWREVLNEKIVQDVHDR